MIKSRSSSQSSLPPQDSVDSACSDELMGSHSRRWLADLLDKDMSSESGDVTAVGRDGLCVDYHFPVGELEMKSGVKWKRPKVGQTLFTVSVPAWPSALGSVSSLD
ncbi:hypothetical protein XENOCAPTIV_027146 [Xenoophorus captivus]|uniref:Uncharacterized protein n=1 Tax=Xenoophorus captivus TaxID=1517983 RepID=A0ABV0QN56_9TELE